MPPPLLSIFLLTSLLGTSVAPSSSGIAQSTYLGQPLPGSGPELFAPGIVSTRTHVEFAATVDPREDAIFFTRRQAGSSANRLYFSRLVGERLCTPEPVAFGMDCFEFEPCFSPGGESLFFGSKRPLPGSTAPSGYPYLWCVERGPTTWGEPRLVSSSVNDALPMYASVSGKGTLYFTSNRSRSICASSPGLDGEYEPPKRLPGAIQAIRNVGHPCVSPDESFLLVDGYATEEASAVTTLFLTYRADDGTWSDPVDLRSVIGLGGGLGCARLSPDGRFLFFERYTSSDSDVYWMWASTIHQHERKPTETRK
jgi:hypothetical protein